MNVFSLLLIIILVTPFIYYGSNKYDNSNKDTEIFYL